MTRHPARRIDLDLSRLLGVRVAEDQCASIGRTARVGTKPTHPVMVGNKPA
ncbi:hypothetical protein ACJ4V0_09235 [Phreatobacter sp. HK31-P]